MFSLIGYIIISGLIASIYIYYEIKKKIVYRNAKKKFTSNLRVRI